MLMRYGIRIETELRSSLIIISNTEARKTLKPNMEIIVFFSRVGRGEATRCSLQASKQIYANSWSVDLIEGSDRA